MLSTIPLKNDASDVKVAVNEIFMGKTEPVSNPINEEQIVKPLTFHSDDAHLGVKLQDFSKYFSFINTITNEIDTVSIQDIMKVVSDNDQFLPNITGPKYTNAKYFIEKYIYNKKILDYTESSFMGDIELVMKLVCLTDGYIKNDLYNDVTKTASAYTIASRIRMFGIELYKYTLNVIKSLLTMVDSSRIVTKLQNYSVSVVYKLMLLINDQLDDIIDDNKELKHIIKSAFYTKQNIDQI